jgi:integrase
MRHTPGRTFPNKLQADAWLKEEEELLLGGKWTDRRRKTTLNQFVEEAWWPRKDLAPRTREEYADVLRLWIYAPVERRGRPPLRLGEIPIAQIGEDDIVAWYNASRARQHPARLAKAYRLLSEVMRFADEKRVIAHNPVRIAGAGSEVAPERRVLEFDELVLLAEAMDPRYRAMLHLATFGALRWGESLGLQRGDVDFKRRGVMLRRVIVQPSHGGPVVGPLKARKPGETRWIDLPSDLMPMLENHLAEFVAGPKSAFLFLDERERILERTAFRRKFDRAKEKVSLEDVTFHVLRHTGATWFAEGGATVRELMERLGHRSERMAIRYQHAAEERMRSIAEGLGQRMLPPSDQKSA